VPSNAPATATGNRDRRTSGGRVASPTPVEISPASNAPAPEIARCSRIATLATTTHTGSMNQ
jgi:hypothetical protein